MLAIGNIILPVPCILAPMAGVSDLSFRLITRGFGAPMAFTEMIDSGKQAVCNFGLPYLSVKQYQLLSNCDRVIFQWSGDKRDIAYSNIANLKTFYRFV
jgi:tRNA-dihydrouridine synthase